MKRAVMQIMRTVVTVIVVGTMAAMIFSLRSDLARARAAAGQGGDPGLFETMRSRTSVRKFDPSRTVDDETVEKLLRAAMCAPTAMDRRTWEFVVVRDSEKIGRLALMLPNSRLSNGARLAIVVCGKTDNGPRPNQSAGPMESRIGEIATWPTTAPSSSATSDSMSCPA